MKKVFLVLIAIMLGVSTTVMVQAQDDASTADSQEMVDAEAGDAAEDSTTEGAATEEVPAEMAEEEAAPAPQQGVHYVIKQKFIEGGWEWMSPVLICLIIGLAIVVERIIFLNLASTNTTKLLNKIEDAIKAGGVDAAKEVCRSTRGPVASIFYQGLDRSHEGIDIVEKSIVSYGSVQMAQMERGLIWISLFIALAPMLGFMGTVVGMIAAFDAIEAAGDISPSLVAGGIKVAILTTVAGLIVAVILQIFYNYLVSKVDSLVNAMEDASISLIDILVKYDAKK
jgi:biopolymer transport protein ExbB